MRTGQHIQSQVCDACSDMNPIASALTKPCRLISEGRWPRRLAEGVSQPPWSGRAAAWGVVVAFAGCEVWGRSLRLLWPGGGHDALWPALITQLPFLCALGYLTGAADTTVERVFGLGRVRVGAVLTSALLLYLLEMVARVAAVVTLSSLGVGMGPGANPEAERRGAASFFAVTDDIVWAPLCEELACRGLLYTALRIRLGIVTSSVLTAAVFSGMHYPASVMEAAFRFGPAVVSSLWYERTRSLWPNVITHAVYNLLATVRWWV